MGSLKEINDMGYQIRNTRLRNPNELRRIKLTELSFEEFMVACGGTTRVRFGVSFEEHRDFFVMPREYSLMHCEAADLEFRRCIAWVIQKLFGERKELISR